MTSRLATSYEDMANKPLNTELLDRAIVFAVRAHAGTERRGKGFPYIVHPMEAVEIGLMMSLALSAQVTYTRADSLTICKLLKQAPQQTSTLWLARQFHGIPYVAHTLELGRKAASISSSEAS